MLIATGGVAIAAGAYHTVFVKSDGTVRGAGYNYYAQLGDTTTTTPRTSAVQMSGISTAVAVAAGDYHTLILLADGTLKGVGYNGDASLGDGTTTNRSTPVAVSTLTGVTALAAGSYHAIARTSDGTRYVGLQRCRPTRSRQYAKQDHSDCGCVTEQHREDRRRPLSQCRGVLEWRGLRVWGEQL